MKRLSGVCSIRPLVRGFALWLCVFSAAATWAAVPEKAAPSAAAPAVFPRAVFQEDSPSGKDPFFPQSRRRVRNQSISGPATEAVLNSALLGQLSLKGVGIGRRGRFALINGATLAPGEQAEFRFGTQLARVRCIEIRDQSVLVSIDGINGPKELRLKEGK